jgi:large subunit ribosomal protein L23
MDVKEVLIRPVVTEKSTIMSDLNKYVFKVDKNATKISVKQAVKALYNVEPEKVNMVVVRGKKKRVRYKSGYKPSWKKAIVTLAKGDKINLFEDQ